MSFWTPGLGLLTGGCSDWRASWLRGLMVRVSSAVSNRPLAFAPPDLLLAGAWSRFFSPAHPRHMQRCANGVIAPAFSRIICFARLARAASFPTPAAPTACTPLLRTLASLSRFAPSTRATPARARFRQTTKPVSYSGVCVAGPRVRARRPAARRASIAMQAMASPAPRSTAQPPHLLRWMRCSTTFVDSKKPAQAEDGAQPATRRGVARHV